MRDVKWLGVLCLPFVVIVFLATAIHIHYFHVTQKITKTNRSQSNREVVGKQQQVVLWTMMRSGSRMTQDLLQALPCTFLAEEPLRPHTHLKSKFAVQLLNDILHCRFSQRLDYFNEWMNGSQFNNVHFRLVLCREFPQLNSDARLTDALCLAACVRLLRVVAVELGLARTLLQDPTLNVRIVHLVRDPRAVIASREHLQELFKNKTSGGLAFRENEVNMIAICDRYTRDLASARSFSNLFPGRYTLVRYEDLALHPQQEVRRLYNFMDLPYTAQVDSKVAFHTLGFIKDADLDALVYPYSTAKNSSATVFAWRDHLDFSEVTRLQQECGAVLEGYGYRTYPTRRHYHDPHNIPLLPLPRPS